MDKNLAAPLLATLAYQHVRRAIAENASAATGLAYEFNLAPVVVERLLRERPAGWFGDYDEMLLRALADAVEEGRRMQGRDPDTLALWRLPARRNQQSRTSRGAPFRQVLRYRTGAP